MFSYERTWFESFLHCKNRGDNSHEIRHKSPANDYTQFSEATTEETGLDA